ncbi:MAG: neutral/alkaline non-lysosomal ceramidase N-terminal domain-containing protein [Thermomicrobiales bacterium]
MTTGQSPARALTSLQLGATKAVMTPPVGSELSGFIARTAPMAGVHDELYARALVFAGEGAAERAALVTLDAIDLNATTVTAIRERAAALTGLTGERIGVACTHTHGGPAMLAGRWLGRADDGYLDVLAQTAAGAVAQAAARLEPVVLTYACGHEATVGRNRRVPGGVIAPAVPVLRFQRPDGTVAALLVNYACHPVTLGPDNLLTTADYPGYVVRTLEAIYPGALALFATGCCGQINTGHTARDGTFGRGLAWRTYGEAERLGRTVAGAATQAAEQAAREAAALPIASPPIHTVPVQVARRTVAMPLLPVASAAEIAAQMANWEAERARLVRDGGAAGEIGQYTVWLEWADAFLARQLPAAVEAEVQVITLGEVVLVLLPGEMFVEFGLAIKERAAPRPVITLAYANGTPGYIPHRSAYPEGGYEVEEAYRYYGYPACFAPEAGETLVEAALELLD